MCKKSEVKEILFYHGRKNFISKPFDEIYRILDYQPDEFEYHDFLQLCADQAYRGSKMHGPYIPGLASFFEGFRTRMYHYKKGKDWKQI